MLSRPAAALLILVAARPHESDLIVAHEAVGPLRSDMGEAELAQLIGAKNLKPAPISIGEGACVPGTIAYPDDPTRQLQIIWTSPSHEKPAFVYVYEKARRYHTVSGAHVGSTLADLEKLNGVAIEVSGFHFDYSGGLTEFHHGKLEAELQGIFVETDPTVDRDNAPGGDLYLSDDPQIRAAKPVVFMIRVDLGPMPKGYEPCPALQP